MTYIEPLAQGCNPYNLFVQPYKDGWRNLTDCTKYTDPALHVVAGILLLIPIINTLVFLILRESTGAPVMNDTHRPLTEIPPEEQRLALNLACPIIHRPNIRNHLETSRQNPEVLQNLDGRIRGAQYEIAVVTVEGLPEATFRQVGGVHQRFSGNHLCGYYALYYMYQAVSGNRQFAHRETFHPFLERWTTMVAERRATAWFETHEEVPAALEVSVRGIAKYEIQHLIENDPALAVLRERDNCFLMEMDEWRQEPVELSPPVHVTEDYVPEFLNPVPIAPLGNKNLVNRFPLFFMLKERMHYYFVWAENPWEFQVVHSTGSSIHNSLLFNEGTFYDIIECLQSHSINN